jgi:uncharacterized Zn finger protein
MSYGYGWRTYVSVTERRQRAAKKIAKLKKSGRVISPVAIEGRKIARTFWGESWCQNLEAYSDYSNRLPRGRTYVRNGSVIDLKIEAGRVRALVSGSSFYNVEIEIRPLIKRRWDAIKTQCAGKIDSMVELLQGSISTGVMKIVTRRGEGLFPSPKEISLSCSCPDWATMCKHVAAALYGVGARLDHEPEMLFTLRGVEPAEMIAAVVAVPTMRKSGRGRILKADDVSSVFGIDLDLGAEPGAGALPRPTRRGCKKAATKTPKMKAAKAGAEKSTAKKAAATKRKTTTAKKAATKRTSTKASKKTAATKRKTTIAKKAATKKASTTASKKTAANKAASTQSRKSTTATRKKAAKRTRSSSKRTGG